MVAHDGDRARAAGRPEGAAPTARPYRGEAPGGSIEGMFSLPRTVLRTSLFAALLVPAVLLSAPEPVELSPVLESQELPRAIDTLGVEEYRDELAWWAADERGGREPGTPGSMAAADRAAARFAELGLKPMGHAIDGYESYFQYVVSGGKRGVCSGSRLAVGGSAFEHDKDWSLLGGCPRAALTGTGVVFAGYGITAPDYEYDDYAGVDVKGKAVLVFRYEPQEKDPKSRWKGAENTRHSFFRAKLDAAKKRGAVAILFVDGPLHHDPDRDPLSPLSTVVSSDQNVPMVHVRGRVAAALLAPAGLTLKGLQEKIDAEGKPASVDLPGVTVDLAATVEIVSPARNVVGLLEGADPILKNEALVIGAHYDHIGLGLYGSARPQRIGEVHNGADDNASGSVGVIELAEAFVESGLRPRRSIIFVLFDAEEKGLVGSQYYVEHPPLPLDRTVAMIDLDMIGRAETKCSVLATGSSQDWTAIIDQAARGSPLSFDRPARSDGGSDHFPFMQRKVPVLFFFTGMHREYHTPDDDAERCNPRGAVEILKVALKAAALVADRDPRVAFNEQAIPPRARIGVQIEPAGAGRPGLRISEVRQGGGAEKAGLRVGDVILKIDGAAIQGFPDLSKALHRHKPGDTVKVGYRRDDQELEHDLVLGE